MQEAQWMSSDELAQRQNARLSALLRYCVAHVPFYAGHARQLGFDTEDISHDSLGSFPIVNKSTLRSGPLDCFLAHGVPEHRRLPRHTSGSTGEPLLHYLDRDMLPLVYASHLFYDSWFGMRTFDRYLRIALPQRRDTADPGASWYVRSRQRCTASIKSAYERLTQEFVSVWEVDREQIERIHRRILEFQPAFILGYTSTLAMLSEYLQDRQRPKPDSLRGIITIGETLTPSRRRLIQDYFTVPIINRYGLREFWAWSAQNCFGAPEQFHVNTEMVVLEVLREDGTRAAPGESGRIVITDLFNRVMPFIRYDTGDTAVQGDAGPCSCGRGFPRIREIEGRSTESLVTPSGKLVSAIILGRYFRDGGPAFLRKDHINYLRHYQAIQEENGLVRFLVVPEPAFNAERKQWLTEDLARLLGYELQVQVEEVSEIPLEQSGKRPMIKRAPVSSK
jgi:phenylacetate-CoA ligase